MQPRPPHLLNRIGSTVPRTAAIGKIGGRPPPAAVGRQRKFLYLSPQLRCCITADWSEGQKSIPACPRSAIRLGEVPAPSPTLQRRSAAVRFSPGTGSAAVRSSSVAFGFSSVGKGKLDEFLRLAL